MKKIVAIVGSASANSSNLSIIKYLESICSSKIEFLIFDDLKRFSHFAPELSVENTPTEIVQFRESIMQSDGVIICTPEYVFSIPSGLKNLLEWSVSTVIFSDKPVGLITASANGAKGHEELQLILRTLGASLRDNTQLLIQGVKGKIAPEGAITHQETKRLLEDFMKNFLIPN
ncbi:NADPH-dependent FMN reductase [Flectobacillus longus]|uniref:NADPH-dependent FMN reductase n=1 Tax=Flectobacillus longus TaxID=2984207 RepID=UPI0024B830B5|nr:NADPH-dependent FMN reductase [Flectobacillus longus]MDI9879157.1 NADPH-dependent FMN reductase [Flectobacillus longus]